MKKNVLAFDFGASSGRAIVGKYVDGQIELEEVHRFSNYPLEEHGALYWDVDYLFTQVLKGIEMATAKYSIDSLGIDTWGVDFGMLDQNGKLLRKPSNYRDPRTNGILAEAAKKMDLAKIYQRTGNQIMEINTLFQLLATKLQEPELYEKVAKILFMPDLINYLLTGQQSSEKSIASTSQLINAQTKDWDDQIIEAFQLSREKFPTLHSAGQILGKTKTEFDFPPIKVINICEHDTASAVVSVPSNQNFLFVSCGTWSLVGTELDQPVINEKAFRYNLTNESGINGTTRFLKNCTGLWIIQEVRRNLASLGKNYSFAELAELASEARPFSCFIDTDDPIFATPGDMITRIQDYAKKTQQLIPESDGALARCVYESLAMKYKLTFLEIIDSVGSEFDAVNIVGGGSQVDILCQMIANAANMRVCAGPVEATAIGNISVQLMTQGVFSDLEEIREWIKQFSKMKRYYPNQETKIWDQQFSNYQKIINQGVEVCAK